MALSVLQILESVYALPDGRDRDVIGRVMNYISVKTAKNNVNVGQIRTVILWTVNGVTKFVYSFIERYKFNINK